MLDVGWMDGWMVGESGIKANSAQFSWSLAELGKNGYLLNLRGKGCRKMFKMEFLEPPEAEKITQTHWRFK